MDEIRYAVPVKAPHRRYVWLLVLAGGFVAGAACLLIVLAAIGSSQRAAQARQSAAVAAANVDPCSVFIASGLVESYLMRDANAVIITPGKKFFADQDLTATALYTFWEQKKPRETQSDRFRVIVAMPNGAMVSYGVTEIAAMFRK